MSSAVFPDERAVFLNVPFDQAYEPLFIALIAALVSIGRIPRSVLEVSEQGQGRLRRIIRQMEACRVSLHDLSRVGYPSRFNMPFELGIAYALKWFKRGNRSYLFVLLDSEPHRLSRTLSDLAGHDPVTHRGKPRGVITGVLDSLGAGTGEPSPEVVYRMWRRLMRVARALKAQQHRDLVYSRTMFKLLVAAATQLAIDGGLLSA